jgi:hypothetical protein
MPLKKPARPKGGRNSETVRSQKPTEFTGMIAAGAIAVVVLGGVAAAMLTPHDTATQAGYTAGAQVREASVADATPPAKTPETKPARATAAPAAAPKSEETPEPVKASESIVTIAGCLEHSDSGFRLTDATGDVVPAARSWKSGFIKKHPANIDVVDSTSPIRLSKHVDERVSVTGPLTDRRMEVRSLRRISPTCADN